MAHLHPSLEGSRIPASLRRSAHRAAIIGSAPAVPPSILSATDASLSGPVMHPPLRPAPPSSPSSPPPAQRPGSPPLLALAGVEIGSGGPSRAGGRGDRLRRAESRWRVWRSASVVCARLTTSMPYRRKWRSCFFSPRVAAHNPLLLTLLPRPPSIIPFSPPRGGLDTRPYLLTLLPSAPRSAPSRPLPLDLFSYFKLVWSDLNCVSAQVSGGSTSSWQGPPPERGCQARHRRRPFHHHGLHGMPLDLLHLFRA
jgi:hypothetical protein